MTWTHENQGSRNTYASGWQTNPFLFLPLRGKKACLNLVKRGSKERTLRWGFSLLGRWSQEAEGEKGMGSNLIKCKLLSWFYHMQMNSIPVKNLCGMVGSAPRIIYPKERVWGVHLSCYWLRFAAQSLMPPSRLSTSVLSECPVFGVSNLSDFTKSLEVGMWKKQAGTWNVMCSAHKWAVYQGHGQCQGCAKRQVLGGCGKSASPEGHLSLIIKFFIVNTIPIIGER